MAGREGPAPAALADRTAWLVLASSLRAGLDLVTVVVLVRLLPQEDFGTYRQVLLAATLVSHLLAVGLPVSLLYFLPRLSGEEARRFLFHTFSILLAVGIIATAVLFLAAEPAARWFGNEALRRGLRLAALFPLGVLLAEAAPLAFIATGRCRAAAAMTLGLGGFQSLLVAAGAAAGAGLEAILLLLSAFGLAVAGGGLTYLACRSRSFPFRFDPTRFRSQLRYSAPLGFGAIVTIWNQQLDKLLVALFFPVAAFAAYSAGAIEIPLVAVLPYTVGKVLVPHFSRLQVERRHLDILPVWHGSVHKVALVMVPAFWVLLLASRDLMVLLYGKAYEAAAGIFLIYLFLLPLRVTAYGSVLQAFGRSRTVLASMVLSTLVNLGAGLALIPALGWKGPAAAAVLAQIAAMAYLLRATARELRCRFGEVFPFREVFQLLIVGGTGAVLGFFVRESLGGFLGLAGGVAVTVAAFVLLASARGLLRKEDWVFLQRWATLRPLREVSRG